MSDDSKICPYAGLRPFSEEESLYFKGRDEHIDQATRQLEKNKFLILTGASGDGKSSLVYAGIVPNARAGFLKSSYSNWAVADFRPERSPFHNLCKSIATQLGIPKVDTVKSELSHGFSALVDLYKASALYYVQDPGRPETDEKAKNILKRKSANLLILADQFEEFFTNPENYQKGVPSSEASLVTNLLLETAQLALEENLPIYVVITMRSDFIGQCAAFRGLPEYIGFSQFFVPRLNRKQLQEVIEEPAHLNGDKISRRLSERLIHDMVEGTDQLPILQHALNQIWKMAKSGEEEMDLIHYAMVGGMDGTSLPAQDIQKFANWFEELPEKIRNCYDGPDLQNVLNTHANKLFNQAEDYVKEKYGVTVSEKDTKIIIETTFRCLTKIDNGRAVRNRMSLAEITAILNQPHLDETVVGSVLGIFREPGNTLLKPYIDDRAESVELKKETVLDITHESLIRNWEHLGEWAAEEFSNYTTFIDFEQQLNRWVSSGKSNSFLLYIGPLTYFENWFKKVKPNAAWIGRYTKDEAKPELNQLKPVKTLGDSIEFLSRSARKYLITRTVMRYGPRRIAAVLGLVGVLVLSSFTVKNYLERRDSFILAQIKERSMVLANNPKVSLGSKLRPVIIELELGQISLPEVVSRIKDPLEKIKFVTGLASDLIFYSIAGNGHSAEINGSLRTADSLMENYGPPPSGIPDLTKLLTEGRYLAAALELRYHYSRDEEIQKLMVRNSKRIATLVRHVLTKQPGGFTAINDLNASLEIALNHSGFTKEEIEELIGILSPFKNKNASEWLRNAYAKSKVAGRGDFPVYGPRFNGLYQELAYLYSSLGDSESTLKCVDTLLLYNQNYLLNNYSFLSDNASNIAAYFYSNNHLEELKTFVTNHCKKININEDEFYSRLIARSTLSHLATGSLDIDLDFGSVLHNTNLEFGSDNQVKFFFEALRESLNTKVADPDQRNLGLALSYKNEGVLYAKRLYDRGVAPDLSILKRDFDTALGLYRKVSDRYLGEVIQFFADASFPRKALFIYPDFITSFHPWEPRGNNTVYSSGVFLEYILDNGLFDEFFNSPLGLKGLEFWFNEYDRVHGIPGFFGCSTSALNVMSRSAENLARIKAQESNDLNMFYLSLGMENAKEGKIAEALGAYALMRPKSINDAVQSAFNPSVGFAEVGEAAALLLINGKIAQANELVRSFPNRVNRATLYAHAAKVIALRQPKDLLIQQLMDSAKKEISHAETPGVVSKVQLAYALATRGEGTDLEDAVRVLKNSEIKGPGLARICRALSYRGELHRAWQIMPENISDGEQADYLKEILFGRLLASKIESPFWKKYEDGGLKWVDEFMFYRSN